MELGITSEPVEWLIFTEFSVFFGLAAPYFATMVFPIFLVATLIDDEYLDASRDLGANPLQTLFLVIVPLCLPGVIAGVVFTMVPMMGEWVVPQLMGGGKVNMIGRSTEDALVHAQLSDRGLPFGLRARDPGCAAGGAHAADPAAGRCRRPVRGAEAVSAADAHAGRRLGRAQRLRLWEHAVYAPIWRPLAAWIGLVLIVLTYIPLVWLVVMSFSDRATLRYPASADAPLVRRAVRNLRVDRADDRQPVARARPSASAASSSRYRWGARSRG